MPKLTVRHCYARRGPVAARRADSSPAAAQDLARTDTLQPLHSLWGEVRPSRGMLLTFASAVHRQPTIYLDVLRHKHSSAKAYIQPVFRLALAAASVTVLVSLSPAPIMADELGSRMHLGQTPLADHLHEFSSDHSRWLVAKPECPDDLQFCGLLVSTGHVSQINAGIRVDGIGQLLTLKMHPGGSPPKLVNRCGGVLLSTQHLLTAAHCVCEKAGGDFHRDAASCLQDEYPHALQRFVFFPSYGLQAVAAGSWTINPEYNQQQPEESAPAYGAADLAVIRLEEPLPLTPFQLPQVKLPGTFLTAGFGEFAFQEDPVFLGKLGLQSYRKYRHGIEIIARGIQYRKKCLGRHTDVICTFFGNLAPDLGGAVCGGDSGGPLFDIQDTGPVIFGIASYYLPPDRSCSAGAKADLSHDRVSHFIDLRMHKAWLDELLSAATQSQQQSAGDTSCLEGYFLPSPTERNIVLEFLESRKYRISAMTSSLLDVNTGTYEELPRISIEPGKYATCDELWFSETGILSCAIDGPQSITLRVRGEGPQQIVVCESPQGDRS